MSQDTTVNNLVINKMTRAQYLAAAKSPTELYYVTDEEYLRTSLSTSSGSAVYSGTKLGETITFTISWVRLGKAVIVNAQGAIPEYSGNATLSKTSGDSLPAPATDLIVEHIDVCPITLTTSDTIIVNNNGGSRNAACFSYVCA